MNGSTLYPLLSTCLIQIIIFINFIRRTDTDRFQRRIFLSVLFFVFSAIILNFFGNFLDGRPGSVIHNTLLFIYTVFFVCQQCSFYFTVVFLDYIINKNNARTKKFIYLILAVAGVNIIVMIMNTFFGFYFYITPDNNFAFSQYFLVRFYMSYSAVLIAIIDIFLSAKHLRSAQVYLTVLFAILIGTGTVLDIVFSGGNLIWAFLTSAMLYAYFFIIHSDTTLDTTTGIGNRSSFAEFINQAARQNTKQSYSMILLDLNGLKKINDAHGTAAGDRALIDLAAILKLCSRQSDFIARLDDDEFIVAIRAKYDIKRMLSRILAALDEHNKKTENPYDLSISYGYDTFTTRTDQSIEEFLQALSDQVFQRKKEQESEMITMRRGAGA